MGEVQAVGPTLLSKQVYVPLPLPAAVTVKVWKAAGKFAVTVTGDVICTVHEPLELVQAPLQPVKSEVPAVGTAVSTTLVP